MINYILAHFGEDEVRKIITMYVDLADYLGDDEYAQIADALIRELVSNTKN